jgi:protein TonB
MKFRCFLFVIAIILQPFLCSAQEGSENEEEFFMFVEHMPEFPGGADNMYKYLGQNIKYPLIDRANGIEGKVFVQFIVEADGQVSNVEIRRGLSETLNEESLRVFRSMPAWEPGYQKGKAVRVQYVVPVYFQLDKKSIKKAQKELKEREENQ